MNLYCPVCKETTAVEPEGKLLDHSPDCTCGHADCPAICLMQKCPKCLAGRIELVTVERYLAMKPFEQGYISYMQASLLGSELSDESPHRPGTPEQEAWLTGRTRASIDVVDTEE